MANVELIDYTGKGRADEFWHAANLLIFTKSTRLEMKPGLFDEVKAMSAQEKYDALAYMANTIPSSWEFVDVTFLVTGVSRPTAMQMVRTRTGSYAMQSQRVTDLRDVGVVNPLYGNAGKIFDDAVGEALNTYAELVEGEGVAPQDARGILPANAESNLVCKYNLRSFVDLMAARSSLRVQGEYSDIADQMKVAVLTAWPWAEPFFRPKNEAAIALLEEVVKSEGLSVGKGAGWQIAKAIDLIRKG